MKAWHFVGDTLRNGSPIPKNGEKLVYKGKIKLCVSGYHASKRIIDALQYAPGSTICRVEMGGMIIQDTDKLIASERTIIARVDGEQLLRQFARMCAFDVIHLWDAPDVVVRYFKTGDESLKDATRSALNAACDAATWPARPALGAAWSAAWSARNARDARDARDAAWLARNATWLNDRGDTWEASAQKQNRRLTRMVNQAIKAGG